jgi:predicted enzyme related to lactoylglutathione lyase
MIMKQRRFCWNELLTRDVEAARSFYRTMFGWGSEDHDMGTMTYTIFTDGEERVGGMLPMPAHIPAEVPAHWFSYIMVTDVDAEVAKLRKAGGRVEREPFQVGDFGRAAIVADPTGAHFALWQDLTRR